MSAKNLPVLFPQWEEVIHSLKSTLEIEVKNLEEAMTKIPWDSVEADIQLRDEGIGFNFCLISGFGSYVEQFLPLEDILNTTEEIYGMGEYEEYGEEGYGMKMIAKLEAMKAVIQERIDEIKAEIGTDEEQ